MFSVHYKSRMIERVVVRSFIYPAILDPPPSLSFDDQFAFRPTGSTTAAVIHLLQTVTDILITQPYVRVISLDFSKAFDSVRHVELVRKLSLLNIPDNIFNWIVSFLEDRIHCTNFNGMVSIFAAICASIIQGSGIGPAAYVVNAGDLQPYNPGNRMSKFADDTRLIVPACNTNTCETELAHIDQWSANNNLQLNRSKSTEIIFYAKHRRTGPPQNIPTLEGIPRVKKLNVLGVTLADDLTFHDHVSEVISSGQPAQLIICHKKTQSSWHARGTRSESFPGHSLFQNSILLTSMVGVC